MSQEVEGTSTAGLLCCICNALGKTPTLLPEEQYHVFPKDEGVRHYWVDFVQKMVDENFTWSEEARICSRHFLQDAFYTSCMIKKQLGMKFTYELKTHAVPSVIYQDDGMDGPSENSLAGQEYLGFTSNGEVASVPVAEEGGVSQGNDGTDVMAGGVLATSQANVTMVAKPPGSDNQPGTPNYFFVQVLPDVEMPAMQQGRMHQDTRFPKHLPHGKRNDNLDSEIDLETFSLEALLGGSTDDGWMETSEDVLPKTKRKDSEWPVNTKKKFKVVKLKTPKQNYSEEALNEAISKIKRGEISQAQARAYYGIPRSTLYDKLYGRRSVAINKSGPSSDLTNSSPFRTPVERLMPCKVALCRFKFDNPEVFNGAHYSLKETDCEPLSTRRCFTCHVCPFTFYKYSSLFNHLRKRHPGTKFVTSYDHLPRPESHSLSQGQAEEL